MRFIQWVKKKLRADNERASSAPRTISAEEIANAVTKALLTQIEEAQRTR